MEIRNGQELYQIFFIMFLLLISILMWFLGIGLNSFFNGILSSYKIVVQDLRISFLGVVIAPINEEIVKLLGYLIIYIFGIKTINVLGYKSKKEFRNDYLIIAFLFSAGGFGFFEGFHKNLSFGMLCFIPFFLLNALAHITYSIYPFLLGRKYKNMFVLFLPVGMLLHSFHNFVIDNIYNNKWVTFTIVTALLLPIVFMERKNFYKIIDRLRFERGDDSQKVNRNLILAFVLIYCYILLCVWLRFG